MREEQSALAKVSGVLGGLAGRVITIALLILITVEGLGFCFQFGHDIFYQQPAEAEPGTDREITLTDGLGMREVAKLLSEEGLIRNQTAFVIQGELYRTKLYPGEYTLNTSMTTKEILAALNTEPDDAAQKQKETESAAEDAGEAVIGGGNDIVDAEQASAAAEAGVAVTPEASAPETDEASAS